MLGRKQEINLQLTQIVDSVLVALAFWLCHSIRYYLLPLLFPDLPPIPGLEGFTWLMAILIPFTPLILELEGFYKDPLRKKISASVAQLLRALVWLMLVIGGCVVFLKWKANSRVVLLLLPFAVSVFLLAREAFVKGRVMRGIVSGHERRERVVMAGLVEDIDELLAQMSTEESAMIQVVEKYDISKDSIDDFIEMLHQHSVNRVILAAGHTHFGRVQEAIHACEREGVEAWLSTDFFRTSVARPTFDVAGGRLMLVFSTTQGTSWALFIKGLIDRVGALFFILATSPLWLLVAIGIKLSSSGPVFFRQERCGRNGMPFKMLKFRTMCLEAEAQKGDLMAENEMEGPVFKLLRDPRIFRFGYFLRRWSLDELPQMVNVLKGEMSLVGPRPLPVEEIKRIEDSAQRRRLSVKPGITCLWQISGRNRINRFEDWVALDLEYIDNWSIWLDARILFRTIPVVVLGTGAS